MGFMNVYEIPELKRIITQYSYEPKEHVVYQGYTDDTIEKFKKKEMFTIQYIIVQTIKWDV